jgi:hypothetical protein
MCGCIGAVEMPATFASARSRYFLLAGVPYYFTELILGDTGKAKRLEDLAPRRFYDVVRLTLVIQQVRGAAVVLIVAVVFGLLHVPQPTGANAIWLYTLTLGPFCATIPLAPTMKSLPEPPAIRRWRVVLVRWSPLISLAPAAALAYVVATT